jgi:iron complex transport system substrate-binding protein
MSGQGRGQRCWARSGGLLIAILLLFVTTVPAATITDSERRTLVFDRPFTRIVSLYPAHTENLLHLGLDREIVACSPADRELTDRPRVQFQDDPERILALRPDLVLIRPMISRGYPNLVRILEQHGVRVVSLQPTTADELFAYWQALGTLTGREAQAQAMIADFGRGLARISDDLRSIPPERRKRVYFESIHRQMKTFAPGSMALFVLESAGGINVARDAARMRETNIAAYSRERILARADEIDVYLAQRGRMNPVRVEDITGEPGFAVIRAVRENQVFLVDEELVSRPTPDLLDGIVRVRALLYPELFADGTTNN